MSKQHATITPTDRDRGIAELRQELQGRLPTGPFEFASNLLFTMDASDADPDLVRRFKTAVRRDARYATARGPYLVAFGLSQHLRSVFDGGRQLVDGGATDD